MSGILQLVNTFPSGGFAVKNSLRFRSSASAYLSRTFGTPTNTYKFTYSFWLKRGILSGTSGISLLGSDTYPNYQVLQIDANISGGSDLGFSIVVGGTPYGGYTSAVFRDPSAWYHIVYSFDTTQATQSNRIKIYVNGVLQSPLNLVSGCVGTYPPQNTANAINSASMVNEIGAWNPQGTRLQKLDGYMAEVNFIDGQALTPSSFGAFDATSGVWQATRYSGTYGTNGFYLKFSDTTSTTTLCYDYSGNSNNWTPNNISLTAGSTYDSMLDSPTNYDNGGNGVGNYAVLNPLAGTSGTVADGNLGLTTSTSDYSTRISTIGMTTGKWYFEATQLSYSGNNQPAVAIVNSSFAITVDLGAANSWAYYGRDGNKYTSGSGSAYGATYGNNDVIGVAFDADAGTLTFYKNNTSQGTAFTGLTSGPYFFAIGDTQGSSSSVFATNFGQRPFAYTPPTGYKALNTQNLSAPSIVNGAAYMAATLYTGNGATQNIINANNSVSFQPDLVWTKARSAAIAGLMYDSVRGATKYLQTNSTGAEGTGADSLTAFNANGFSAGADTSTTGVNQNGTTYVGWQWKAGGTAVTNTAGSITSSVSANTTAGFSVVTYTGTGASGTVGHGLGVAPSMIISKSRNNLNFDAGFWDVYHIGLTSAAYFLKLNTTDSQTIATTVWNSTAPTSTVYSVGTASGVNAGSSATYVAYCFAAIPGYSAFGSYTGNGSADGPFVFTGMRPRWIMVKRTDSASAVGWFIWDTSRASSSGGNVTGYQLYPNSSTSESSQSSDLDILSNGFKLRGTYQDYNASGGTYIYAAFAENPFKYSLAR